MQLLLVATINANAGGTVRNGEIQREGSRYVAYLNRAAVGQDGSLAAAAHRLAAAILRDLKKNDANWGVAVQCVLRAGVNLAFGNQAGGGGGGGAPENRCVANVIVQYSRGENSLPRALEFAAKLLAECCS